MRIMYRIAIVEDDPMSVAELQNYIDRFAQERNTQFSCSVFSNGMDFISDYTPVFDVVLMDIEMPHMNGLKAAHRLREVDGDVCLIFVTNLAKYAIEGYAVSALDFLVKPVEYHNFSLKLQRALEQRNHLQKKEVVLNTLNAMRRIRLDDIYYVEVMDHSLVYHTSKGDFSERCTIKEREEQFKDYDFVRCSNSFLVNLRYVTDMEGSEATVAGNKVPVGRTKRKAFMTRLTEYLGDSF